MISDEEVSKSFLRGMVTTEATSADRSLVTGSAPSHGEVLCRDLCRDMYRGQLDEFSKECQVSVSFGSEF